MVPARSAAWSLIPPLLALALEAHLAAETPDLSAPTAIEQALVENTCMGVLPLGALDSDAYRQCLRAQLLSLRTNFGRDLDRLTRTERRQLDSACSGLQASGREAYLDCLDAQLASLLAKRQPPKDAEMAAAAALFPLDPGPLLGDTPYPTADAAWPTTGLLIGGALGFVIVAAGGAHLARRSRRPAQTTPQTHACRLCGAELSAAGDLCAACRHEAAETRRRAAAERTGPEGPERLERRDGQEGSEGQEGPNEALAQFEIQRFEQMSLLPLEDAQRPEETLQPPTQPEVVGGQPVEEARSEAAAVDSSEADETVFDPYAVLGVAHDASREAIRLAYDEAKSRYDPSLVAHLGYEVQQHFKAKAQALDRAYQALAG